MPNFTLPITLAEQAPAVDIYNGTAFAAQVTLSQPLTDFERMSFLFDDGGEAEITVAALRQCGLSLSGNNITVIDDTTFAVAQQPGSSAVLAVVKGVGKADITPPTYTPTATVLWEGSAREAGVYSLAAGKEWGQYHLLEFYFDWPVPHEDYHEMASPIGISQVSFANGEHVDILEGGNVDMRISRESDNQFRILRPTSSHILPAVRKIIGINLFV